MTSWSEPGANPLEDIRRTLKAVGDIAAPNSIVISTRAAALLAAWRLFPGRGPLNWLRRRVMRWALEHYFARPAEKPPQPEPTPEEARVLAILRAQPGGRFARATLAREAGIPGARLNKVVAELRRRGLVALRGRHYVGLSDEELADG